jgi:hypothetical protein
MRPGSSEQPESPAAWGFVGRVEYGHVYSRTGGARYGRAVVQEEDLLVVYAEAFERDAVADDFSLDAIIAHEPGHQLLARHRRLTRNLPRGWSVAAEEIAASVVASLLVGTEKDQRDLLLKALFEADKRGLEPQRGTLLIMQLRELLEKVLC